MATPKPGDAKNALKIAGVVLFLCGSLGVFFYRLPHQPYVEVHADKPRPKPAAAAPAPAPVPAAAQPARGPQPPQRAPLLPAAPAAPAPAGPALAPAPAMPTVSDIYTAERIRDPFAPWGAAKGVTRPFTMDDFSIHKLSLRGIMKDPSSDFALFVDGESGTSFLLRKGRLYDAKNKAVAGVGGTINIREKMVTLTAPEGDVQVFRLGEEEKE